MITPAAYNLPSAVTFAVLFVFVHVKNSMDKSSHAPCCICSLKVASPCPGAGNHISSCTCTVSRTPDTHLLATQKEENGAKMRCKSKARRCQVQSGLRSARGPSCRKGCCICSDVSVALSLQTSSKASLVHTCPCTAVVLAFRAEIAA